MTDYRTNRDATKALSDTDYAAKKAAILADAAKAYRNAIPPQDTARIARDALQVAPAVSSTAANSPTSAVTATPAEYERMKQAYFKSIG